MCMCAHISMWRGACIVYVCACVCRRSHVFVCISVCVCVCMCTWVHVPSPKGNIGRRAWVWRRCGCLQEGGDLGWAPACRSPAHLVFIKDVENKRGKLGRISKWEELLIDFLEACSIQLPAGAILDEALVPGGSRPGERG